MIHELKTHPAHFKRLADPRIPDLAGFTDHGGIRVASLSEDGDLIALGHHKPRRALAAFRRHVRTVVGDNWYPDTKPRVTWAVQRQRCTAYPNCGSLGSIADGLPCHDYDSTGYPDHAWGEWSEPSPRTGKRLRSCDNCDLGEVLHPDGHVERRDNPCEDCAQIDEYGWYIELDAKADDPEAFPITLWRTS